MPKDPVFSSDVTGTDASGGNFTTPVEPWVGDPAPNQSNPGQTAIDPHNLSFSIDDRSKSNPVMFLADGSMPTKGKWDNIVLDDTELCAKTPEELLEVIKQMREIEQMLDPILLKLIEDVAFAPQFDKLKKFRETNLEMLRLAMNIFNKKVESQYDLAPAAGKKRGTKPS